MGSGAEAEEGSLAGASHPEAVHCLWQCVVWGSAAQPASFHSSSSIWRCGLPHAPCRVPHVWLHRCSRGTESHPSNISNVSTACWKAFYLFPPTHVNKNRSLKCLIPFEPWHSQKISSCPIYLSFLHIWVSLCFDVFSFPAFCMCGMISRRNTLRLLILVHIWIVITANCTPSICALPFEIFFFILSICSKQVPNAVNGAQQQWVLHLPFLCLTVLHVLSDCRCVLLSGPCHAWQSFCGEVCYWREPTLHHQISLERKENLVSPKSP